MNLSSWLSPEGVTAVATILAAIFAFMALKSVNLARRQIVSDHERSRRERAVEIMTCFLEGQHPTNHETTYGIRLIYALDDTQCRKLWKNDPFSVDEKQQQLLELYRVAFRRNMSEPLSSSSKEPSTGSKLSLAETLALNRIAITVLNRLETIASAWRHSIADQEILEEEFKAVFCPEPSQYVLETYREASGIYPSIRAICDHYKKRNAPQSAKLPTGSEN